MSQVAFEVAIIFLLLIANGVFAMAEIAVVSCKKARLRRLADQGNGKARVALELAESPTHPSNFVYKELPPGSERRFLSAIATRIRL